MAVVENEDKRDSQNQILATTISMNKMYKSKDYTRDLINKFMAEEAAEAEQRRRCRVPLPTGRHVVQPQYVQPHQFQPQQVYVQPQQVYVQLHQPQPQQLHVQPQQLRMDTEKIHDENEENYELILGLSSNGRFGFDPNAKKIKRAASIPESSMIPVAANEVGAGNLIRTCSLPIVRLAESREEWLRRKELQSQRRLEARKRKNEKRRHSRAARERNSRSRERGAERGAGSEGGGENSNNNNNPIEQQQGAGADADGLIRTTSLVRRVGGMILNKEKDQVVPISPSSGGSSGTSSEVLPGQGTIPMDTQNSNLNLGNIIGSQTQPKILNLLDGSSSTIKTVNFFEGSSSSKNDEPQRNPLDDMPSVTTKGSGPNGRRIEGFLYKYGRGRRNVKIVCVCHGSFLTPAEFVRHAGGGDVPNPLQQIIVHSSSS